MEFSRRISLKPGEEIVGFYKKHLVVTDALDIMLRSSKGQQTQVCISTDLIEPKIIQRMLRSIKVGQKIGILRLGDSKPPICIRKISNGSRRQRPVKRILVRKNGR